MHELSFNDGVFFVRGIREKNVLNISCSQKAYSRNGALPNLNVRIIQRLFESRNSRSVPQVSQSLDDVAADDGPIFLSESVSERLHDRGIVRMP